MKLRDLLEYKLTPAQAILNRLNELKWAMIHGKEKDSIIDKVLDIIDSIGSSKKVDNTKIDDEIEALAKKYGINLVAQLSEAKFDMVSSLKNSIIGWEVALKKTSDKEKTAHLTKRIKAAKAKLAEIAKNSK